MYKPPSEIRQARLDAGLTQKQCAELVSVAFRTWQDWEYGKRKISAPAWELFCLKVSSNGDLK